MELHRAVYNDTAVSVALVFPFEEEQRRQLSLAIRWLKPQPYIGRDGREVQPTNKMGGETDWFILPKTFGYAVGRVLVEQKTSSMLADCFDDDGFELLVKWLVDDEELTDCMCY